MLSLARPNRHSGTDFIDGTVITLRSSISALAISFTCFVSACVLAAGRSWIGFAIFLPLSAISALWQVRTTLTSPVLIITGTTVRLYKNEYPTESFYLDDMSIAQCNVAVIAKCAALIAAASVLVALGLSKEIELTLFSSVQRFTLTIAGVAAVGVATSLAYRDFPRRKLWLRGRSGNCCEFYLESRKQRQQLLTYLRAIQLEQVMVTIGLTNSVRIAELRSRGPFHSPKDESGL